MYKLAKINLISTAWLKSFIVNHRARLDSNNNNNNNTISTFICVFFIFILITLLGELRMTVCEIQFFLALSSLCCSSRFSLLERTNFCAIVGGILVVAHIDIHIHWVFVIVIDCVPCNCSLCQQMGCRKPHSIEDWNWYLMFAEYVSVFPL